MQLLFVDHVKGRLLDSEQPSALFDAEPSKVSSNTSANGLNTTSTLSKWPSFPGARCTTLKVAVRVTYADRVFYREHWGAYRNRGLIAAKVATLDDGVAMFGIVRSDFSPQFTRVSATPRSLSRCPPRQGHFPRGHR